MAAMMSDRKSAELPLDVEVRFEEKPYDPRFTQSG